MRRCHHDDEGAEKGIKNNSLCLRDSVAKALLLKPFSTKALWRKLFCSLSQTKNLYFNYMIAHINRISTETNKNQIGKVGYDALQ